MSSKRYREDDHFKSREISRKRHEKSHSPNKYGKKPVEKDLMKLKPSEEPNKPFVKEKVNFNKSGKLLEDTNMQNGVVVKYSESFDAAKPTKSWRLYPFKNDESLPFIPLHRKSYYLLGRDRKVADIPLDHPSISKQHAVIQFRKVELEKKEAKFKEVRPYLMDLDSSNKTYLNNKEIGPRKYYELLEKDVIKFGFSSREYVVLVDHEEK